MLARVAALALVLTGGAAPDGGGDAPLVVNVKSGLVVAENGRVYELDGGAWLADELLLARARDLERYHAEAKECREKPVELPPVVTVGAPVAVVLAAIAGFLGGYFAPKP